MTVKELLEELQKIENQDAEVVIDVNDLSLSCFDFKCEFNDYDILYLKCQSYARAVAYDIDEFYLEDLKNISELWEKFDRKRTVDYLINSSVDSFISSFCKNNKKHYKRVSKEGAHKEHFYID